MYDRIVKIFNCKIRKFTQNVCFSYWSMMNGICMGTLHFFLHHQLITLWGSAGGTLKTQLSCKYIVLSLQIVSTNITGIAQITKWYQKALRFTKYKSHNRYGKLSTRKTLTKRNKFHNQNTCILLLRHTLLFITYITVWRLDWMTWPDVQALDGHLG